MDVRNAVRVAKSHVEDLFADEGINDLGLEEVEMEQGAYWKITIGFTRPWSRTVGTVLGGVDNRSYKVVRIRDKDGIVLSLKDRTLPLVSS